MNNKIGTTYLCGELIAGQTQKLNATTFKPIGAWDPLLSPSVQYATKDHIVKVIFFGVFPSNKYQTVSVEPYTGGSTPDHGCIVLLDEKSATSGLLYLHPEDPENRGSYRGKLVAIFEEGQNQKAIFSDFGFTAS